MIRVFFIFYFLFFLFFLYWIISGRLTSVQSVPVSLFFPFPSGEWHAVVTLRFEHGIFTASFVKAIRNSGRSQHLTNPKGKKLQNSSEFDSLYHVFCMIKHKNDRINGYFKKQKISSARRTNWNKNLRYHILLTKIPSLDAQNPDSWVM